MILLIPWAACASADKPLSEEMFSNIEAKICLVTVAGIFSGPHCAGIALISFDEPKETWQVPFLTSLSRGMDWSSY